MARKAQSDWFFLQKCYTICVRRAKINWKVQKAWSSSQKNSFFPGLSVIFSVCPEKLQQPIRPKWFWPKKLQLFRPKWFWPEKLQQPIRPKWFGSPFCWRGSPFGPHFTENWVPILKKVCPQGLWPQCRYKRGSLLATAGSGWLIRDTIESNTINACTCTILNWEMCNIVNTRFLRHFGVITEITAKSPQKLYHGSFFGPFLRCDFSCP